MALQRQSPQEIESTNKIESATTWIREFFEQFRLAWRLLVDKRVPFLPKILPLLTVGYLIMPVDLIPDVILGLGQLDDLIVLIVGMRLFINICPPALVEEHIRALSGGKTLWSPGAGPVIDIESVTLDDEEKNILEA